MDYKRLRKFRFRQNECQKQSKLAKRPAINEEKEDDFIQIEVEQQSTGVSDQGTKIDELPSQIEVNPEAGQSDEGLLEPKTDIYKLMDINTEAKSKDSGAQPTTFIKTKPNSTPGETSSKIKVATQKNRTTVQQEIRVKNTVVHKQLHKVQVDKQAMKTPQTGKGDLAEL